MSDELEDMPEVEVIDLPEEDVSEPDQSAAPEEEHSQEQKPFDPKTDRVDVRSDDPEKIQAKIDYLYKQAKSSDARNAMLTDFLAEQQRQLDEVKGRFSQTDEVEAEKVLMNRIQTARESGDDAEYDLALNELISFRTEKVFEKKVNDLTRQEQATAQKDAEFVAQAMTETDENGEYLRPWLQEDHPDFGNTLYEIQRIARKYEGDPNILSKTLKDLDSIMSKKSSPPQKPPVQNRAPNPMQGSNFTNQRPKGTIRMTKQEADILRKLEQGSGRKINLKNYAARRDAMIKGDR